jgi:cytochrome c-type biogenesis protein CcmE
MKRKRAGLLIAAVVVLAGFGYLVAGGIGDNLVYFVTPGELLAKGEAVYEKPIRLGGQVMPGTVHWDAASIDLRFVLQDEEGRVEVRSRRAPPQMFREGQGVIVEGKYTRAGVFESTNLLVKHSNEYRPPEDGHPKPTEMYRSLIREPGG